MTLQYQLAGQSFVRCGSTFDRLEPGMYEPVNCGSYGWGLKPKGTVTDDLIDIPGTIADSIFEDIDGFLASKDLYTAYGLTHKRGYLFYGPPGSGKTSIAMMLAKRFVKLVGGIVVFAGDYSDFYNGVAVLRDVEPGRPSMYLIEEADEIVDNTHCLSILDGELSVQGAVFVAMTNYKDRLPPRIANRPGRFDIVQYVDCPPAAVQLEYLRRVESRVGKNPAVPQQIVDLLEGLPVSLAHLREAFVSHVLLRKPLLEIRDRFDAMAGVERDAAGRVVVPSEPDDDDDGGDDDDELVEGTDRRDPRWDDELVALDD